VPKLCQNRCRRADFGAARLSFRWLGDLFFPTLLFSSVTSFASIF